MMWTESDFRTAAHVCTIIGLIGVALRVFFYFVSSRPNETYSSFHTRVEFGEFRSPAIRARMEQDPEFRRRMEALLRSRVFRLKSAEVASTRSSLQSAVEAAKVFSARVAEAKAAKEAAAEGVAVAASREPGHKRDPVAVAEASARLLAAERDETRVKAQILERTAKHQAAKAVVTRIMLTVAQSPGAAGGPGRAPLARAGGGTGVRDLGGPVAAAAAGASAKGGAAAAIEPMDISSATSMEEGRPLL